MDRWGFTPLDTAIEIKNQVAISELMGNGAISNMKFKTTSEHGTQAVKSIQSPNTRKNKENSPTTSVESDEFNIYEQDLEKTYKIL